MLSLVPTAAACTDQQDQLAVEVADFADESFKFGDQLPPLPSAFQRGRSDVMLSECVVIVHSNRLDCLTV